MNQNGGDAATTKSTDAVNIASLKVEVSGNPRRGYETGDGLRTMKSSASAKKRTLHARFMGAPDLLDVVRQATHGCKVHLCDTEVPDAGTGLALHRSGHQCPRPTPN